MCIDRLCPALGIFVVAVVVVAAKLSGKQTSNHKIVLFVVVIVIVSSSSKSSSMMGIVGTGCADDCCRKNALTLSSRSLVRLLNCDLELALLA
jgi:hypothetical protein